MTPQEIATQAAEAYLDRFTPFRKRDYNYDRAVANIAPLILTAAAKLVKESGAVEALESCKVHYHGEMSFNGLSVAESLAKLRAITEQPVTD